MALKYQIPIHQPINLKSEETFNLIKSQKADFMIVAAYGLIIPQRILELPQHGCLNIHGSLLPKWRGAAPIQRSLLAGDNETGITIIQMDSGLDTGDMLLKYPIPIEFNDTTETLYNKLTFVGAASINAVINSYSSINPEKQDNSFTCYAEKLTKEEALINWSDDVTIIHRKIRGYNPIPGAFSFFGDKIMRIWKSDILNESQHNYKPGQIVSLTNKEFLVACGNGVLSLEEVQFPGSKKLLIKAFLSGFKNPNNIQNFSNK